VGEVGEAGRDDLGRELAALAHGLPADAERAELVADVVQDSAEDEVVRALVFRTAHVVLALEVTGRADSPSLSGVVTPPPPADTVVVTRGSRPRRVALTASGGFRLERVEPGPFSLLVADAAQGVAVVTEWVTIRPLRPRG
jgi:hypothetical protein